MERTPATILADALQLNAAGRAEVAAELLASLDEPADADVESAWDAEIVRRLAAVDRGELTLLDWSVVRQQIEHEILGR